MSIYAHAGGRVRLWMAVCLCAVVSVGALSWVFSYTQSSSADVDADNSSETTADARFEYGSDSAHITDEDVLRELEEQSKSFLEGKTASSSITTFLDDLAAQAEDDDIRAVSFEVSAGIISAGTTLLSTYAELETTSVSTSGYLDLKGNAWGAIIQDSRGWVDIVALACDETDATSSVRVVRFMSKGVDTV